MTNQSPQRFTSPVTSSAPGESGQIIAAPKSQGQAQGQALGQILPELRVRAKDCPRRGKDYTIVASDQECHALALACGVLRVARFRAAIHVRPAGGGIRVKGKIEAQIEQVCSVSLKPFWQDISDTFDEKFVLPEEFARMAAVQENKQQKNKGHGNGRSNSQLGKAVIMDTKRPARSANLARPEWPERPEILENGGLDIGALAGEYLVLAIDPYPRKAGVTLEQTVF